MVEPERSRNTPLTLTTALFREQFTCAAVQVVVIGRRLVLDGAAVVEVVVHGGAGVAVEVVVLGKRAASWERTVKDIVSKPGGSEKALQLGGNT